MHNPTETLFGNILTEEDQRLYDSLASRTDRTLRRFCDSIADGACKYIDAMDEEQITGEELKSLDRLIRICENTENLNGEKLFLCAVHGAFFFRVGDWYRCVDRIIRWIDDIEKGKNYHAPKRCY